MKQRWGVLPLMVGGYYYPIP